MAPIRRLRSDGDKLSTEFGLQSLFQGTNETMHDKRFKVGVRYTRNEVADQIGLPSEKRHGGFWATGYPSWLGETFVFCTVGQPGRTGHDYPNRWMGDQLVWVGNTRSRINQPSLRAMASGESTVHVFWRESDREPFTYAGIGVPAQISDTRPAGITWAFNTDLSQPQSST